MAKRQQRREAMEATQETGTDPAVLASAASVALSWFYFFARDDREMGLFVGLWPPTILAFASYFKQTRMSDRVDRAMGKSSGITKSVQRMMGGR
jgi:hypothetical protein